MYSRIKMVLLNYTYVTYSKRVGLQAPLLDIKIIVRLGHLSYVVLTFWRKTLFVCFKVKAEGQRKGKHQAQKMKVIITLGENHLNHPAR